MLNAVAEKVGWGTPAPQASTAASRSIMGYRQLRRGRAPKCRSATTASSRSTASSRRPIRGYAVNPAQIERQVAGSFVYGLSALLYGECTVKDGAIEQENFDTYNLMRIDEMPKVEIDRHAVRRLLGRRRRADDRVAAPAVLNAIFAATGKRIRSFPLKNHGIMRSA